MNGRKKEVLDLYIKAIKKNNGKSILSKNLVKHHGITRNDIEHVWDGIRSLETYVFENYTDVFKDYDPTDKDRVKKKIAKWYVKKRNKTLGMPKRKDLFAMTDTEVTKYMILNHFRSVSRLEEYARKHFANDFKDRPIRSLINKKTIRDLRDIVKDYNKFVISTAVTGTPVDEKLLKSLKRFCRNNKAKLLILVCSDPAKSKETLDDLGVLDPLLAKETIVFEDTALNSNLHISTIKLSAKTINPITGLQRIGKQQGSFIYAAPKFFLEYTSVRNNKDKWPHAIMTTGAITIPDYRSEYYMSQRTAYIAEFDHTMGAVFVEIKDDSKYFFRQLECLNDKGEFYFENKLYTPEKVETIKPELFNMGDLHSGSTCSVTKQAWVDIIKKTKPKRIALHDALNGTSVNHWLDRDIIEKARLAMNGDDSLEKELEFFTKELKFWSKKAEEILIIPSNHNDWLERWLRSGKYAKDARNHYIGLCLAKAMMEGHNPLRFAVEEYFGEKLPNVVWLGRNDDYFIGDVQINCHGDVGLNGSKGSIVGMERAYGSSISGHSHSAGIIRRTKRIGTSTHLQEDYNNGPGIWTNTSALVYEDGSSSLYNSIDGEWRL